ncbi:MAG: lamin tail domain-containing protein [Myxococcota bacterium]
MTLRQGAWTLTALAVVFAGCTTPEKPPPPEPPPVITSFTVDKTRITRGESVTFTVATQRAKSATIIDQNGQEIAVTFDEAAGTGTASTTPMTSSFYILHADGPTGRDTAFVQVAVDQGLESIFLVVVPQVVKAGESVDVVWSAAGGTDVTVTAGQQTLFSTESGAEPHTPTTTTTYTLSAKKLDGSTLTTSVTVQVVPVIESFTAEPPVAPQGQEIKLSWQTAGGERVVISEATFGELVNDSTNVASGTYTFRVPYFVGDAGLDPDAGIDPDAGVDPDGGVTDGGAPDSGVPGVPAVRDGFPLRFTLTLSTATPAQSVSRAVDGRVGQGPVIDRFDVPANATNDRPQTISWQTTNATRVELYADGLLVAAPRAGQSLDASFTVPPITATTEFTLVAYDFTGLSVRQTKTVTPVQPPTITSFTVTANVSSGGSAAMAQWQTTNAARVVIRVKNGANVFFSDLPSEVGMGSTTLRPAATTTFVLDAYNAAGDKVSAERTTTVATPVAISFSPDPAAENTAVTAQWDVSSLGALDLPGLPNNAPQVTLASTSFIDLATVPAATKLTFSSTDNGAATFTAPQGFVFPFVTSRVSTFTASTNGALVLGSGAAGNTNVDIGATGYAGAALLAPFWDDLDLGSDGEVKYFLDGAQFPRKLIVQWNSLEKPAAGGSELTFQVQLFETGKFLFVYKTLTAVDTDSATVGVVESPRTFAHQVGFNTAGLLTEGQETLWFANDLSRVIGTQVLTLASARPFGFFVENSSSQLIAVNGMPRVFAANSVLVNEVMPVPNGSVPMGQWVELLNTTGETIDLTGLELVAQSNTSAPFSLQGLSLDAGAYLVVGQSTDPVQNGEANVSVAWGATELPMQAADRVELRVPGTTPFVISGLSWTGGPADGGTNSAPGESVQAPEPAITASGALTCTRMSMFGVANQIGTPGTENEACFEYKLQPIPVAYEDISASGTPLYAFGVSIDETAPASFTLPTPFTYFGAQQSQVWVSPNSWLAFTSQTSATLSNRTVPSSSTQPVGAVAPFWDDTQNTATATPPNADSNIYWERRGTRTIVQWHRWRHFATNPPDDLNFQVKLFDNGVIEFHYATMSSGTSSNYGNGNSSTIWIERPTGTPAALAIGRNQAVIAPNTAYRFTPKP